MANKENIKYMDLEESLKDQDVICWEVDNTIINGINSRIFQAYIKTNKNKEHHIVTFRPRGQEAELRDYLTCCTGINPGIFRRIITQPQPMDQNFRRFYAGFSANALDTSLASDKATARNKRLLAGIKPSLQYKAKAIKYLNSQVLVDNFYEPLCPIFEKRNLMLIDAGQPLAYRTMRTPRLGLMSSDYA